jgi:hypothetical protein
MTDNKQQQLNDEDAATLAAMHSARDLLASIQGPDSETTGQIFHRVGLDEDTHAILAYAVMKEHDLLPPTMPLSKNITEACLDFMLIGIKLGEKAAK